MSTTPKRPVVMAHSNHARIDDGVLTVDRKFHIGMNDYVKAINAPLVTLNPEAPRNAMIMDAIQVKVSELSYRVVIIPSGHGWRLTPEGAQTIREEIAQAVLLYGGFGNNMGAPAVARACGVPYIPILEYDLQTQIKTITASGLRRVVGAAKTAWYYYTESLRDMRQAHSVHCNGYPIYDFAKSHGLNALLYFDSRMSKEMIMAPAALDARLDTRTGRPLRLLYSGRYESMKGSLDAVKVGLECMALGIDIEVHCYGQGSLASEMRKLAAQSEGKVTVHDAVPYPELVKIARTFDVFVCCHVQNDPSCTYLESFGAGLTIVGYANAMWRRLCAESNAGFATKIGNTKAVANCIQNLVRDQSQLAEKSRNALAFAQAHSYEIEHTKRIDAIKAIL